MRERKMKPDAITYTLWMNTVARGLPDNPKMAVDVAAAFDVWDQMKKSQIQPGLRGYNELLAICNDGSRDDREIALELYQSMLVEGITPDHRTFDILLMNCWKQSKFELANEFFDKALELSKSREIKIDTHLCNAALRVCTRIEARKKATIKDPKQHMLAIIAKIRNVLKRYQLPYNEETYALLITAYARAGAKDTSLHTLEDLLAQEKIRLTKKTIGALLAMCKETNDVEETKKALELAKKNQVKLPESIIEMAKMIFFKNKRHPEWVNIQRDLEAWMAEKKPKPPGKSGDGKAAKEQPQQLSDDDGDDGDDGGGDDGDDGGGDDGAGDNGKIQQKPRRHSANAPKQPRHQTPKQPHHHTPKQPHHHTPEQPHHHTPEQPHHHTPEQPRHQKGGLKGSNRTRKGGNVGRMNTPKT